MLLSYCSDSYVALSVQHSVHVCLRRQLGLRMHCWPVCQDKMYSKVSLSCIFQIDNASQLVQHSFSVCLKQFGGFCIMQCQLVRKDIEQGVNQLLF